MKHLRGSDVENSGGSQPIPDGSNPPDPEAHGLGHVAAQPERSASKRPPTQSAAALWHWVKMAGLNFTTINGTVWSASFAYYAFFALFPMVLLLITLGTGVAAHFVGEQKAKETAFTYIVGNLDTYVPTSTADRQMIRTTIHGVIEARGKIGLVALIGILWSAMGFFQSLVSAVNQAWGHDPLNWWKLPLKNLIMVGVLLSALLVGGVVPAVLKTTQGYLAFGGVWTTTLFNVLIFLVPTVVLFYGFLLFYKLAPRRRAGVTFSQAWIPALLVATLLQLSQQAFVFYATHITNFNAVYGTFGGVVALMLWIYVSGLVIVFGGCLCAAQRQMHQTPAGPDV